MMDAETERLCAENGIQIVCELPFELETSDGDTATGWLARLVVKQLREERDKEDAKPEKQRMKVYEGQIKELADNQIFVFGANTQGRHGKGAALFARQHCGAIYGVPRGPQGRSYAIITKDLTKRAHPSVSFESIIDQIDDLYDYARRHPESEFVVAYSGTGTNLNGYTPQEMASMFKRKDIPENMVFEKAFAEML